MVKRILLKLIPNKILKQLRNFYILAVKYSQYKTIKLYSCVDKNGKEIPWYTYPAIEYLCNIDFSDKNIFEFGSGYSSLFWARRAKSLISVEHDEKWYKKIKAYCIKNQQILLKEVNNKYEETIIEQKIKYDVIIIDGIRRPQCSKIIKNYLNFQSIEGCMVILDNSDWYRETAKYLRENLDMIEVDFHGFGPINDYTWTTSVFVSRNFRFKSNNNVQPHFSISAIKQSGEG